MHSYRPPLTQIKICSPGYSLERSLRLLAAAILLALGSRTPRSSLAMKVTSPPAGSAAFLSDDGGLEVTFLLAQPAAIKVDVFGFADPNGWPSLQMGQLRHTADGALQGSVRLYDLSLGAVRIRFRALSADGRDAIGEESVEYFVQPYDFFADMYASSWWLQPAVKREVAACCGASTSDSCLAADASAVFCETALGVLSREVRANSGGGGTAADGDAIGNSAFSSPLPEGDTPRREDATSGVPRLPPPLPQTDSRDGAGRGAPEDHETAVFALMHGYDLERLVPFVESLRSNGYRGSIHLAHSNPEISCEEEGSAWCARLKGYLRSRNVTVEGFPDEIPWGRQQLHHHDTMVRHDLSHYPSVPDSNDGNRATVSNR